MWDPGPLDRSGPFHPLLTPALATVSFRLPVLIDIFGVEGAVDCLHQHPSLVRSNTRTMRNNLKALQVFVTACIAFT